MHLDGGDGLCDALPSGNRRERGRQLPTAQYLGGRPEEHLHLASLSKVGQALDEERQPRRGQPKAEEQGLVEHEDSG